MTVKSGTANARLLSRATLRDVSSTKQNPAAVASHALHPTFRAQLDGGVVSLGPFVIGTIGTRDGNSTQLSPLRTLEGEVVVTMRASRAGAGTFQNGDSVRTSSSRPDGTPVESHAETFVNDIAFVLKSLNVEVSDAHAQAGGATDIATPHVTPAPQ